MTIGANPGFHEGVADILSLAVGTAEYFQVSVRRRSSHG